MRFSAEGSEYPATIIQLLEETVAQNGSDLHLVVGMPPCIRKNGELSKTSHPIVRPNDAVALLWPILQDYQKEQLETNWELDFSYAVPGCARFRGNIIIQRGSLAAVFRTVPFVIPAFEKLGLPECVKSLCDLTRGLVLVTGPTGSGKSTTLASMIDIVNNSRACNIVTVEDPIEFLHSHKNSSVRQREIGTDTHSFAAALRQVLRHDPDIIMIGEMRDTESIGIALTAAETGHLVFSTLHTQTAPLTISRIIDSFSDERRGQVRQQLANSLRAVVSQQLVPRSDKNGMAVAGEFMLNTPAVRRLVREGKEHQLYSAIQTGHSLGMQTMDQSLIKLYRAGIITRETAVEYCVDKAELERLMAASIY